MRQLSTRDQNDTDIYNYDHHMYRLGTMFGIFILFSMQKNSSVKNVQTPNREKVHR